MNEKHVPDSEEDDSDYVQDEKAADDEDEDDEDEDQPEDTLGASISAHKKSMIDDVWVSMNAETATIAKENEQSMARKGKGEKKRRKTNKKANKVLAGIFGKRAATSIVSGAGKAKKRGRAGDKEAKARAKELAASRTVEVAEVKKYAGKDIVVKRTVTVGSAEEAAAAAKRKKAGLDKVLAAIDGPKSLSTVTKSSLDWDKYKADEGIEGDMQQAVKDGKSYLNRQDFLQRCDVRKFENELDARQAKRDS